MDRQLIFGLIYLWLIGVIALLTFLLWAPIGVGILIWGLLENMGIVDDRDYNR